jgi:hypothetical protein
MDEVDLSGLELGETPLDGHRRSSVRILTSMIRPGPSAAVCF